MISHTRKILLSAGAACALALAAGAAWSAEAPGAAVSLASPKYGTWGFDLSGMDRSVKPGDDFYQFANGKWAERTQIPADKTRFGNFDNLGDLSENRQRAILDDAVAGKLKDPDAAKIAAGYKAFMDEALAVKMDAKPIAPALAEIRKVRTKDDFTALMGKAPVSAFTTILPIFPSIDQKSTKQYAVYAATAGMGLPDRDYYLTPAFAEKKAKYQAYVEQMLTMVGWDKPKENAAAIVAFETQLAEASWTRIQRRDRDKTYNPKSLAELQVLTPGFDWNRYLAGTELPKLDRIVVTTDTAFPKFAKVYADTSLETLKAWQVFNVADQAAPYLSKRFVDATWQFRNRELGGQPEQKPRWKRGVAFMDGAIGESVGRVYVARYFPPESKAKMDALVVDVRTALKARIENLDWMGPDTKARALEKLSKFTVKIGYTENWRDYAKLELKANDAYGNARRANDFEWRRNVARLGGPVSTTQVVSTAIMGAGAAERVNKVRWGVATNILIAWVLTIPATALLGAALLFLLRALL